MYEEDVNGKKVFSVILIGGLIILGFLAVIGSFYTVQSGERAVLFTFEKAADYSVDEGLHFKWPFAQKVKKFEVRTRKFLAVADSSSGDMQVVATEVALNYHIDPEAVHTLFTNVGVGYEDRIISPSVQEATKSAMANYKAEELIAKRSEVRADAINILKDRLGKYNIIVDDFSLMNFDFSDEFDAAIEAKQTAEQDALRADNELRTKQTQVKQDIAQAEADAESVKLEADAEAYSITALADAEAYSLRVVNNELAKSEDLINYKVVTKWGGNLPNMITSSMAETSVIIDGLMN